MLNRFSFIEDLELFTCKDYTEKKMFLFRFNKQNLFISIYLCFSFCLRIYLL